jgi:hypothetical protein
MDYSDNDNTSPTLKIGAVTSDKSRKAVFPQFVIQKYMEKPALFKGYKFDIRGHALLTQNKELLIYRDSYVRVSSLPYHLDNQNYFAHLCNTSVNKRSESFGKLAAGNTLSASELGDYFDQKEKDNPNCKIKNFEQYFFEEMRKIMKLSFDAMHHKGNLLNPNNIPNTFELFGFDMMVDESYKCWLIEANYIPGLTDDGNEYAKRYFDRMTDDMFKLTVDEIFPAPKNAKRLVQTYPLEGFNDEENLWQKIFKYQ